MFTGLTPRSYPPRSIWNALAAIVTWSTRAMVSFSAEVRRRLVASAAGLLAIALSVVAADASPRVREAVPSATAPCGLPLPGARVVELARIPLEPWKPGHRGIDMAADVGDEVVAPADATVEFVGFVVDRPVLTLRHAGGRRTSLEPVETTLRVGDVVAHGAPVGAVDVAPGHCAPGTCVHWSMRHHDDYIDPLTCVPGFGPIVLLPLT